MRPFWRRLYGLLRKFSRLPDDDTVSDEPIDFSAPSVPYYVNLAEKFNLARIVLYMVLFAFVVVTVLSSRHLITYENLYYLVKDVGAATLTAQSEADHLNYPMSDAGADFVLFRGGLTVAGGQEVTVISGSGKQTLSDNVALSNPCVRSGGPYCLVFGRGEKNFSVYNAFVRVRLEPTDFPVYDACMAESGSYAVLSRSADYKSEVIFYNEDLNKVAAIHLGGYVTAMCISPDGKTLATMSLSAEDGGFTTKMTLVRRGAMGTTSEEVIVEGATALTAEFISDDRIAVVYEDRMCVYQSNGHMADEVPFEGNSLLLTTVSDGYAALLFGSADHLSESILKVFDKNGKMVYNVSMDSAVLAQELILSGQDVYLRLPERMLWVSDKGKKISEAAIHRDTIKVLLHDSGSLYACCPAYAERIDPDDFSEIP